MRKGRVRDDCDSKEAQESCVHHVVAVEFHVMRAAEENHEARLRRGWRRLFRSRATGVSRLVRNVVGRL